MNHPFFLCLLTLFVFPYTTLSYSNVLSQALDNTWTGLKQRNVDPYRIKCVHRPNSETPDDCVSEGIGYGMILALYSNDQEYFNKIWESGETYMWNGRWYDWRIDVNGFKTGTGAATDAEQDIAFALISAQRRVDRGDWEPSPLIVSYGERAQSILDSMWTNGMISSNKNVAPGAGWGGNDFVNPGYFAPAWYRVFDEVDTTESHDWNTVIDHCYDTILQNVGVDNGLIPDWTSVDGNYYEGNLGYNAYGNGKFMFKDGIRTLWRVGTDYLWNSDKRARQFLENSYNFISMKGGVDASNYYQMDGQLIPKDDVWSFAGGHKLRYRREHGPLTVGMWSVVPYVLDKDDWREYLHKLLSFYERGALYWGRSVMNDIDSNIPEDIQHNELYFDQFLAWFGGVVMNGTWTTF